MAKSRDDIGTASQMSGCSVAAIRFYEEKELLPKIPRNQGGRRQFSAEIIAQIRFIRSLRNAGLSLQDIKKFTALQRDTSKSCNNLADFALAKAKAIRQKISALRVAEAQLNTFANACQEDCSSANAKACRAIGHLAP